MKNASRTVKNKNPKVNTEATAKAPKRSSNVSPVAYQVETKRDSKILLAFITFNYRVFHPAVTSRLLFYGVLVFLPGFFVKIEWAKILFFAIGALLLVLGLARQYISLALTKSHDADYKAGTVFKYDFTINDMAFYKNDEPSSFAKYKDITGFYYDDQFYYLMLRNREFHILPKSKFTKGDSVEFEEFIYKKSHKACQWIPAKFKDKLVKRRAMRDLAKK